MLAQAKRSRAAAAVDLIDRQRLAWSRLHMSEMRSIEQFEFWLSRIPSGCDCRKKIDAILARRPPDFGNWFPWTIWFHNEVNSSLGHDVVSMDRAMMLWKHVRPNTGRTKCIVTVAHGRATVDLLRVTKPLMQAYAERCDADLIDLDNETQEWWGLEKFRSYYFATQYDECLFLDADAIVRPTCPSLFDRTAPVAMHDDYPYLPSVEWLSQERSQVANKLGVAIWDPAWCLNSGVVYTRRCAADIWMPPESDIGKTHCAEQIVVESRASKFEFERLLSIFNWQWYFPDFSAGVPSAQIIHLANCPTKLETARQLVSQLGLD